MYLEIPPGEPGVRLLSRVYPTPGREASKKRSTHRPACERKENRRDDGRPFRSAGEQALINDNANEDADDDNDTADKGTQAATFLGAQRHCATSYVRSTVASTTIGTLKGRAVTPGAARACLPASPQRSTIRSLKPLTTRNVCGNPDVQLT
jgi:hypothetical protein